MWSGKRIYEHSVYGTSIVNIVKVISPLICLSGILVFMYVTGPEKTGLIYTKYTYLYYGAYLFFRVYYPNSVSFIEFRLCC